MLDVAQVEVLRGPQATLYGRNTEADVLNVITNDPDTVPEYKVGLSYGSYNRTQADALAGGSIGDSADYNFANGFFVRTDYNVTGSIYFDNANTKKQSAYGLLNLFAGYTTNEYDITAYVKNVTNETYVTRAFNMNGDWYARTGEPVNFGVSINYIGSDLSGTSGDCVQPPFLAVTCSRAFSAGPYFLYPPWGN